LRSSPKAGLIDRAPDPSHQGEPDDEQQPACHPEVAEFARWFADWWLRRGHSLVLEEPADTAADERRAA
jgi:hypothetical protein